MTTLAADWSCVTPPTVASVPYRCAAVPLMLVSCLPGGDMMPANLATQTIVRTEPAENGRALDVTLSDRTGTLTTLRLAADTLACLVAALQDLGTRAPVAGPVHTKMPSQFAVGHGRFDPFVLIRFESDIPYALDAGQAAELAHALLDEADEVATTYQAPMRQ